VLKWLSTKNSTSSQTEKPNNDKRHPIVITALRNGIPLLSCIAFVLFTLPLLAQPDTNNEREREVSPDLEDIRNEQAELRDELDELEKETKHIQRRLKQLEQLEEVQAEFDRVIELLERAEDSDDEQLIEKLEARIEPLERHLDGLREQLENEEHAPDEGDREEGEIEIEYELSLPLKANSTLVSGTYTVSQTWSQEKNFHRPYHVHVPTQLSGKKLPVFIFLHGNGGNAQRAMRGYIKRHNQMASQFIMVFPQGYQESWNIVSERSKADDLSFIEAIVNNLSPLKNVDPNNFSIMGASNGAALVNQLAIESNLPNIRNYISGVSPLNVWQYDGKNFKAKGEDNNYTTVATPLTGKRLMNISGTEDHLVPYRGGPSKHIPAKDGKLAFVDAERSTFLWAQHMGYQGEQLNRPTRTIGNLEVFSYLDGAVVHYKVVGASHGATHEVDSKILLDFLNGPDPEQK